MTLERIISGGPTGVDRAGLDVALALGLAIGGGCPQGRRAEDGIIPDRYPLTETPERDYQARTRRNVEDADGTLILNQGALDGGTALTVAHALKVGKPCWVVALEEGIDWAAFRDWLDENRIATSNVAGPRESQRSGVYAAAVRYLEKMLRAAAYPRVSSCRNARYGYSSGARNAFRRASSPIPPLSWPASAPSCDAHQNQPLDRTSAWLPQASWRLTAPRLEVSNADGQPHDS